MDTNTATVEPATAPSTLGPAWTTMDEVRVGDTIIVADLALTVTSIGVDIRRRGVESRWVEGMGVSTIFVGGPKPFDGELNFSINNRACHVLRLNAR